MKLTGHLVHSEAVRAKKSNRTHLITVEMMVDPSGADGYQGPGRQMKGLFAFGV